MISSNLSAVSLRDFALVDAVARHGSFNSAARAMHISPSGLSHQVQKVEQALGSPLFERGGRRIVPTASGRQLLTAISSVLSAGERLQQAARAGLAAFGGLLRLGVPVSLGPYLLPHLSEPFPRHFPGTHLSLSEGKPRGLLRRLHEGELDIVLAPLATVPSGIASADLFAEPWQLMVRADHPLAHQTAVEPGMLDPHLAIQMAECHPDGLGQIQDVSLESLAALVSLRGGYALVPALASDRLASIPEIRMIRLEQGMAGRLIALYWREASPWQRDVTAFRTLLLEVAKTLPDLRVALDSDS